MFVSIRFSLTQHSISMTISQQPPCYIISPVWEFLQFIVKSTAPLKTYGDPMQATISMYTHSLPNLPNSNSLQGPIQVRIGYIYTQLYVGSP